MNKRELFMRKEQLLKTQSKLDSEEQLAGSDWEVLRYLVGNRIFSKWKLELCERLLQALQDVIYNDYSERGPLDEEVKITARVVVRSEYLYRRLGVKR